MQRFTIFILNYMSVLVKEGEKLASTLEHEDEDEGKDEHAGLDARVHFFHPQNPFNSG
jgi:hypothetical protein